MSGFTSQLRLDLERKKAVRDSLVKQQAQIASQVAFFDGEYLEACEARAHLQLVAKKTQQELEYHISDMVTKALAATFDDPYTFNVEFVLRRDKTEADRIWSLNGEQYQPNGGGVRDVSAFALRLSMWKLQGKGTPVLILDEPGKHCDKNLLVRFSALFAQVSKQLGIQIIMVSHAKELITSADRAFEVTKVDGVSQVTIQKE